MNDTALIKWNNLTPVQSQNLSKKMNPGEIFQIQSAIQMKSFELVTSFLWGRSMQLLKSELGQLGDGFIADLSGRSVGTDVGSCQFLSDFEAIRLSSELQMLDKHGSFQLKQAMEIIFHYNSLASDPNEIQITMPAEDAAKVINACVENILCKDKIEGEIDFKRFLDKLETEMLTKENVFVTQLQDSPYFYLKTFISVFSSKVRSLKSARVESLLYNGGVIIPLIWSKLKEPERDSIGKLYRDVFTEDNKEAALGMRLILLSIGGFDYVPENLRSNSFISAAKQVINAHFNMNNFYNEPKPMQNLSCMGKVPRHAIADCLTAAILVKIGNQYGVSVAAQQPADDLLSKISEAQWSYFIDGRLLESTELLSELSYHGPVTRWLELCDKYKLYNLPYNDPAARKFMNSSQLGQKSEIMSFSLSKKNQIEQSKFQK